jgi:putative ABC transport system permease protein
MPRIGPDRTPEPIAYVPLGAERTPGAGASLIVRTDATRAGLAAVAAALREDVRALDPDLPLYSVEMMDAVVARGRSGQRLMGGFLGMLAFVALVLATVGVYAVTAHVVARRTHEIGVRMALGARAGQVLWLFARRTLVQLAFGLTIGLAGALVVGQLLRAFLVDTAPRDAATLTIVSLLLIAVASAAAYVPARHAARLDPLRALRDDQ